MAFSPWSEIWSFTTEAAPATPTRFGKMMLDLLPRGLLWRNLNETFQEFMESWAAELKRIDDLGPVFIQEAFPGTSTLDLMLEDWERVALLGDERPDGSETEQQRQQVVAAKVTTGYTGPSRQFFTDLAAKFGMTVLVTDGTGDETPPRVDVARVDVARLNDVTNIFQWNIAVIADPLTQLTKFQALVDRIKPAHTQVEYF